MYYIIADNTLALIRAEFLMWKKHQNDQSFYKQENVVFSTPFSTSPEFVKNFKINCADTNHKNVYYNYVCIHFYGT